LQGSTRYTFTVTATTADGTSAISALSNQVTTPAYVAPTSTSSSSLAAPAFTISSSTEVKTVNNAITGYTITSTGGTIASYTIAPASPAGTTFNTATGLLSGTPSATQSATTYTITATNASGSATRTFTLTVQAALTAPVISLSKIAETTTAFIASVGFGYTVDASAGGAVASYALTGTLPAGLTFNTSTGLITGSPTETKTATTYTITATNTAGSATATYQLRVTGDLGDIGPGGGIIFYVTTTPFACGPTLNLECRYLEAAPTTGTAAWADFYDEYEWSGDVTTEIGTTGTAIGDGLKNTLAMVSLSSTPGKAGTISRAFRGPNNLTDWHLPSKDELNQLYIEKTLVGFHPNTDYWSSSESAAGWAWSQFLDNGVQNQDAKNYPIKVRPIRAF